MQKFNVNGQSVSKIEWKQTDGQTNGCDCITSLAHAVGNNSRSVDLLHFALGYTAQPSEMYIGRARLAVCVPV